MALTLIPIGNGTLIPIFHNDEPEKCPKCGKNEDTKVVCRYCGHEYVEEEKTVTENISIVIFLILLIVIPVWGLTTIFQWITYPNVSLIGILYNQSVWVSELLSRIW